MIKIILKNLLRNKRRSFLTLIGVIVGVAGIVSLVSISFGVAANVSEILDSFQGIYLMEAGAVDDQYSRVDVDYVNELQKLQGVKYALPQIFTTIPIKSSKVRIPVVVLIGIDPELSKDYEGAVYYQISNGRKLKSTDKNSVVISENLRKQLGQQLGGQIVLNNENYRIVGTFESDLPLFDMMVATTLDVARKAASIDEDQVTMINLVPENPDNQDRLKEIVSIRYKGELQAMDMQESSGIITSFIGNLKIALWAISGIAGIVGGIVVTNTMLMSVMERMKEFGILKAIGWQNSHIIQMIIMESIALSIIGGIIGVGLGMGISAFASYYSNVPTVVTIDLIIQAMLFALVMGIVGGIYPAMKSAKMSPVEATIG